VNQKVLENFHSPVDPDTGFLNDTMSETILDIILSDDADRLPAFVGSVYRTFGAPEWCVSFSKYFLPSILGPNPSLTALCAFFAAGKCFEFFQRSGCDLSRRDGESRTLDHFAAAGGSRDIILILDAEGHTFADLDSSGLAPVHYAVQMGHKDIVDWFWSKGAS
jgi:hypothetical protein